MRRFALALAFGFCLAAPAALADEFAKADVEHWQQEFDKVVKDGRANFTDGKLGTNGVACAQCHPNGANTHPETYPKFQKQFGRVAQLWEMVNWCIKNPLQGKELSPDDAKMISLVSYIYHERRGVALTAGRH